MSQPAGPPLTMLTLGLVASITALLAGGWLMLAPFALGYQPDGAAWSDATVNDFVVSLVLLTLGLIATIAFAAAVVGRLVPRRRPAAAAVTPAAVAPAPSADDELITLLRPLVAALEADAPTGGPHAIRNADSTVRP